MTEKLAKGAAVPSRTCRLATCSQAADGYGTTTGKTAFEDALQRGMEATQNGAPFIIGVDICRTGGGADST